MKRMLGMGFDFYEVIVMLYVVLYIVMLYMLYDIYVEVCFYNVYKPWVILQCVGLLQQRHSKQLQCWRFESHLRCV